MPQKKTQKLTIFLLKKNVSNFEDCIQGKIPFVEINKNLHLKGRIYIGQEKEKTPGWISFLRQGVVNPSQIDNKQNVSNRAVIVINHKNRFWAIPFGHGRHLLREEVIENNFGLKTVLNAVNAEKLFSVDTKSLSDFNVTRRIQTGKSSVKDAFGMDIVNDLMNSVTGEPNDPNLGRVISGREQIVIAPKIEFIDLSHVLNTVYKESKKATYLENFDWIDDIMLVKDPLLINNLDTALVEKLNTNSLEKVSLAPPEPINWLEISAFKYTPKGNAYQYLDIVDLISNARKPFTVENLKSKRIYVIKIEDDQTIPKWNVYKCICSDIELNQKRFVLVLGEWYVLNDDLYEKTITYLKKFKPITNFPNCGKDSSEKEYNLLLEKELSNSVCLDGKTIKCVTYRDKVELCDLFQANHKSKKFIHIKNKDSSATLSHLFAQGRVSAEAFSRDEEFRKKANALVAKKSPQLSGSIKLSEPNAKEYTVAYGIIDSSKKELLESLPFFSLINLKHSIQNLKSMHFEVELIHIKRE